jgi:signal transduction histidine kinase/DNA-binding NarL/FixJ family response regulator
MSERRAAFLAELTARLTKARDEAEMVRVSLDAIKSELAVSRAFFVEGSETLERAILSVSADEPDRRRTSFGLEQLGGLDWWRQYSAGNVAVEAVTQREQLPAGLSVEGEQSFAVQALERRDGWTVTLAVANRSPRTWQKADLWLLSDVLARVWPVIERARVEAKLAAELAESERSHDYSEWVRLLWETAALLLTAEDPEALVRALFVMISSHMQLDVFLNHMQSEGETELRLFSFAGISSELAGDVAQIHLGSPLIGNVALTREPYTLSGIQTSTDPEHELVRALGVRAYACVPLVANDRLLGTLAFGSRRRDHFGLDEVEFLRAVTRYMTVAYERLRLVRELRDADRKKDDFIALLAHELRNPLAPLRNGLAVMRLASADSAAVERARAIMERQLSHMVRLIEDLLDVSRISLNKMQLRRAPVLLADVVSNALETARPAIDGAEHQLEVLLPSEPILLDADLTRLAQVFGNLLTNAAKYTPKRGHIVLRAERQEAGVAISVEDNGIGLRPESLRSIFGMFSQVDHSVERSTGGLGIGLALVKGLTEMHGGTVRAESAGPGQGSRFVVQLPALSAEAQQRARAASTPARADKPRRRILVADDNHDAVDSLATMLRLAGNEVHMAHDGVDAVERAEALQPDVVLMDIGMPRLNGYEATRRIRGQAWGKHIVVIALTGWGQASDRRLSSEAGCDAHLVKPVDHGQLDELMNELCARRIAAQSVAGAPESPSEHGSAQEQATSIEPL